MPKMITNGPKGTQREICWPEKGDHLNEEVVFVAIREVLEESCSLCMDDEGDRLVLASLLTKLFKKRES